VNAVMNLWVPENAGNLFSSSGPVSFSGRTLLRGRFGVVTQKAYLALHFKGLTFC
jgi:hypothetical protein